MKGKRTYGSPLPSPEKPAGKRRCLVSSTPHITRSLDLAPPGETEANHDTPSDNVPEVGTSSRTAANLDCPTQHTGSHDQSDHDTEQPPETGTSQALVLVKKPSVIKQNDAPIDMSSELIKAKAAGTLLSDWPATSHGVTEGICNLQTLKRFMASNDITDDHKAMWVSVVQTIVHEPDQKSVLLLLQNLLSGDSMISGSLVHPPGRFGQNRITRQEWAVTGPISLYAREKSKWSAAHFVDLALRVGGPDGGIQAARAIKIFGLWTPSGQFEHSFTIESIDTCLDYEAILRKI